ncbi:MAG: RidA family protein, partial [Proteobacteria bacterium]|nr:RidA family protein [Pseudomonadota bacterium]
MTIDARLKELDIELPDLRDPSGSFVHYVQTGNLLYLAGAGPKVSGKVGIDFTVEEAAHHAW